MALLHAGWLKTCAAVGCLLVHTGTAGPGPASCLNHSYRVTAVPALLQIRVAQALGSLASEVASYLALPGS